MRSNSRWLLVAVYWGFALYLFVPLVLMVAMGFKDSNFIGFPITAWTTRWYADVVADTEIVFAFGYSFAIAVSSTLLSLFIGVWVALFLGPTKFWWKMGVFALMCLPAVVPGIISAVALRIFIRTVDLDPGMAAIVFGHTVHNVPFVALIVMARLGAMPKSQIEAARDLGADALMAFVRVTLPYLRPSLVGAGIFCMLLSFDDFVRSYFLGSYQPTLPVLIFAKLTSGMSPEINAVSTMVLVVTAILGLWAERSMRRLRQA